MVSTTLQEKLWNQKGGAQEAYPGLRTLTIKRKWFDEICAGEKTVEYREYCKRIETVSHAPYIKLVNGYRPDSAFLICELLGSSMASREEVAEVHPDAMDIFRPGCQIVGLQLGKVLHVHDPKKQSLSVP